MGNISSNRITTVMTQTQIDAVNAALQTIFTNMPFLIGLTPDERITLPKINVSNKAFTEDALDAIDSNAAMLPTYLHGNNMREDLRLYEQLDDILRDVRKLYEQIEDTQMLAGSEAYTTALAGYRLFGAAAQSGMPGMDSIYNELRERFANQGGAGTTSPPNMGTKSV